MYGSYPNAREQVVDGNIAMDEGLKFKLFDWSSLDGDDVFSKDSRTYEWHFYAPDENRQEHDRLFVELKSAIDSNSKNFDKLLFIGGMINLLEDMSIAEHDNKKLSEVDTQRVFKEFMFDNILCNDIDINEETLEEIRLNTSKKTVEILNTDIPDCENVKWNEFWSTNNKENIEFGEKGLIKSKNGSTCKFIENDPRYKDFVYSLHKNAINTDFKLLNWSTKNILKRDKKLKF